MCIYLCINIVYNSVYKIFSKSFIFKAFDWLRRAAQEPLFPLNIEKG